LSTADNTKHLWPGELGFLSEGFVTRDLSSGRAWWRHDSKQTEALAQPGRGAWGTGQGICPRCQEGMAGGKGPAAFYADTR